MVFSIPYLRTVMTDFPSNSQRPRRALRGDETSEPAEKAKINKVVEGEVIVRKKPMSKRFRETFIGGDGTTVWEFVKEDILIPAFRDLIADTVQGGMERMLYGDSTRPLGRRVGVRGGLPGAVRYDLASRGGPLRREDPRPQMSRRARATHDFEEIILPSRSDAEATLTGLFDILEQYNEVKVSDLYELVGYSSNFADERYGWTDLRGSNVRRAGRLGYILELPKTEVLER
jgi:hypothetical protein